MKQPKKELDEPESSHTKGGAKKSATNKLPDVSPRQSITKTDPTFKKSYMGNKATINLELGVSNQFDIGQPSKRSHSSNRDSLQCQLPSTVKP